MLTTIKYYQKSNKSPNQLLIFSACILFTVSGAWTEEPRTSLRPLKRNSEMKYQSRSLRLSNNDITELHDLQRPVRHFLAEPSLLAWLDLSFNKISHIDQVSSLLSVSYVHVCLQNCLP